jgi:predicted dinucleotide-binding enzyme
MTTIAIIGAGSVGRALGTGLGGAGHDVTYGVRSPDDPRHGDLPSPAVRTPRQAAEAAEVVILAVPADAVPETLRGLGLRSDHVVVDATNAVRAPVPDGHRTMGDLVASLAPPGVAVVKAFNTIGAEHLSDGHVAGTDAFLPVAGDRRGTDLVAGLATQLGFDAVVLGDRDAFDLVEAHAAMWIHLAFRCGFGRGFGFGVLRG